MIIIVDYNVGNIRSIQNMLSYLGYESKISTHKEDIELATKLILPGVGSFDTGMKNIKSLGLDTIIKDKVLFKDIPILGICLGAQLMLEKSDEGKEKGLSIIEGNVRSFASKFEERNVNLPIPNIGWRDIQFMNENEIKFNRFPAKFYFVHSFYFELKEEEHKWNISNYGFEFCSGFRKDNIFGVQFHPEKSHKYGMKLLNYFVNHV